jgi:hypothetical protein
MPPTLSDRGHFVQIGILSTNISDIIALAQGLHNVTSALSSSRYQATLAIVRPQHSQDSISFHLISF